MDIESEDSHSSEDNNYLKKEEDCDTESDLQILEESQSEIIINNMTLSISNCYGTRDSSLGASANYRSQTNL